MDIFKAVAIVLSSAVLILLLRRLNNDYALLASSAVNIGITVFCVLIILPVFEFAKGLSGSGFSDLYTVLFKSTGICIFCSIGAELCRGLGEASLGDKIEFAGKCTLLAYSLPLIKKVFEYAKMFIY